MTEAEWLASDDPAAMLRALSNAAVRLKGKARERKLRLFACACCRQVWGRLPSDRAREAVEVAERFADGAATREELLAACHDVPIERAAGKIGFAPSYLSEMRRVASDFLGEPRRDWGRWSPRRQAALVREVVGNPFSRVRLAPAWLTPTVADLAAVAYAERDLPSGELDRARLGVLADALEDAGCAGAAVLEHLRAPGPHVRGCWALDTVLGKG
jgi:hypothetical protein